MQKGEQVKDPDLYQNKAVNQLNRGLQRHQFQKVIHKGQQGHTHQTPELQPSVGRIRTTEATRHGETRLPITTHQNKRGEINSEGWRLLPEIAINGLTIKQDSRSGRSFCSKSDRKLRP